MPVTRILLSTCPLIVSFIMHLRKKNSFLKRMRVWTEGQYRAKHGTLDVNLGSARILFPNFV